MTALTFVCDNRKPVRRSSCRSVSRSKRCSTQASGAGPRLRGLTFHDLRGSAVTRLSLAGASPQEIAGVTGHSLADVHVILNRHYLGERATLAEAAIRRLERKEK